MSFSAGTLRWRAPYFLLCSGVAVASFFKDIPEPPFTARMCGRPYRRSGHLVGGFLQRVRQYPPQRPHTLSLPLGWVLSAPLLDRGEADEHLPPLTSATSVPATTAIEGWTPLPCTPLLPASHTAPSCLPPTTYLPCLCGLHAISLPGPSARHAGGWAGDATISCEHAHTCGGRTNGHSTVRLSVRPAPARRKRTRGRWKTANLLSLRPSLPSRQPFAEKKNDAVPYRRWLYVPHRAGVCFAAAPSFVLSSPLAIRSGRLAALCRSAIAAFLPVAVLTRAGRLP